VDEATRNAILAVVAVAVAGGNLLAWILAQVQLFRERNEARKASETQREEAKKAAEQQREETKKLVELTSNLEHRVRRMSAHLDHRIFRLERVRDLITPQMQVSIGLRQEKRSYDKKLDLVILREMALPEAEALIVTINDDKLKQLGAEWMNILSNEHWLEIMEKTSCLSYRLS
jgi:hypothetical protein